MVFMLPVLTWAMHLKKDTQSCTVLASTSLWLRLEAFCSISDVHGLYFCGHGRSCNGRFSPLHLSRHVPLALCLAALTLLRSVWPSPERCSGFLEMRDLASADSALQKSCGADCALWSLGSSPKPRSVSRCLINSSCNSRSAASFTLPGLPWPVDKHKCCRLSLSCSRRGQTPRCAQNRVERCGSHHQSYAVSVCCKPLKR